MNALKAIIARINGVFDDPDLIAFGPLGDTLGDVLAIAETAPACPSPDQWGVVLSLAEQNVISEQFDMGGEHARQIAAVEAVTAYVAALNLTGEA